MTKKEAFKNLKKAQKNKKHRCYFCNKEKKDCIKLIDGWWEIIYWICKDCFLKNETGEESE